METEQPGADPMPLMRPDKGFFRPHGWVRSVVGAVALMAGALLPAGLVASQQDATPEQFQETRRSILNTMSEEGLPSVAVGVARGGEILWEEGFGWADRAKRMQATAQTMYSLASISKPITATAVMLLVSRGDLSLDDPANDYLGRTGRLWAGASEPARATIRRILSHTAGLPLHYQFFYGDEEWEPPSMDQTIGRYGVLVYPPGQVYQYSNLGYGVLDQLIARVSGRTYEDFMRAEVFLPLGMTRTSVQLDPDLRPFAAERYDSDYRPIPFYDFDHRGASAVYSSVHDLLRFGLFHLGYSLPDQRPLLSDSSREAMRRVHTPGDDNEGYALGWSAGDDRGLRRIAHSGGMPGVRTVLALYPEEQLVVTALTNAGNNAVFRIAEDLVAAVLPEYADSLAKTRAEERASSSEDSASAALPERFERHWEGRLVTWGDTIGFFLEVLGDGDVHVRIGESLESLLNPLDGVPLWNEEDGRLLGRFAGTVPTSDALRHPHSILLDLRLRNGRLSGQATAQTTEPPIHFALSSYVELQPVQAAQNESQ